MHRTAFALSLGALLLAGCKCSDEKRSPSSAASASSVASAAPAPAKAGPATTGNQPPVFGPAAQALEGGVRLQVYNPAATPQIAPGEYADAEVRIWLADGKEVEQGSPTSRATFSLDNIEPPALQEALRMLAPDSVAEIYLSAGSWRPDAMPSEGVLMVRMSDTKKAQQQSALAGANVTAPPPQPPQDAAHTQNGIAYVVLTPGDPKTPARGAPCVTVLFDAWDYRGETPKLVMSSARHQGSLGALPNGLGSVIAELNAGSRARVWLTEKDGAPGAKPSMAGEVEVTSITCVVAP
jgi:hypothetical protein